MDQAVLRPPEYQEPAAEREGLIVLCDDRDFLTVAAVTGQPVKLVTHV